MILFNYIRFFFFFFCFFVHSLDRSCIGLYTHSFNKPPRNVSQKSGFLYEFFESRRGVTTGFYSTAAEALG